MLAIFRLYLSFLTSTRTPIPILELSVTHTLFSDIDKSRSTRSNGARLGGSLFASSSVPSELQALVQPQTSLSRAESAARALVNTANTEYTKMTDPANPVPTPPVHAARLSSLLKNLASAEGAVNDSMRARTELIAALEKLLQSNKNKLSEDDTISSDLAARRVTTEAKKKEVEDGIMRGLSAETFNAPLPGHPEAPDSTGQNAGSPQVEALTPPPPDMETFTPTASPKPSLNHEPSFSHDRTTSGQSFAESDTYPASAAQEQPPPYNEPAPSFEPPLAHNSESPGFSSAADSLLRSLALPPQSIHPPQASPANGATMDPRLKRRKVSHQPTDMDDELFAGNDGVGIDSDVAAMLGAQ